MKIISLSKAATASGIPEFDSVVHRARGHEGAVPVKLGIAYFCLVSNQGMDTSDE